MLVEQEQKSESLEERRMKRGLSLVEAALYVAGRPLDLKTLGSILRTRSAKKVQALARMLAEDYEKRGRALQVIELDDGRFVLQLKPEFVSRVKRLALRSLLTPGPLKTLSYIAYRQPIAQAHIVKVRGSQAYEHIKELEDMSLVRTEKLGKTKIIRTTDVFADYFNLSRDIRLMKRQLKAMFETLVRPQPSSAKSEKSSKS